MEVHPREFLILIHSNLLIFLLSVNFRLRTQGDAPRFPQEPSKNHSYKIEMVKRQYSGNAHGLVKGIGIVNLVHAYQGDYHPMDFRVYDPDRDGKTKNDHFRDMLRQAFENKDIQAQTILFDCWYAASENLKFIHRLGKFFVTTLKENRLVSLGKEQGYIHLQQIEWTPEQLRDGITVKLKEVPFRGCRKTPH